MRNTTIGAEELAVISRQKVKNLLSDHEAQFISWRIFAPLVVKLLRDAKIVAMEQRMSQLFHAMKDLQQGWWQPMLFIDMPKRQQQIKPLGSYTMSPQGHNDK